MKKFAISFPLASIASALLLGLLVNHAGNKASVALAETSSPVVLATSHLTLPNEAKTFIPMEPSSFDLKEGISFEDPQVNDASYGVFADKDATYWDRWSFGALDTFFRGEVNEKKTYDNLELVSWTQYTRYVYFQWGGAADFRGEENGAADAVYLNFCFKKSNGEWLSEKQLNNTFVGNPMLLRYYKINDDIWAQLDHENGFEMKIQFVDNAWGNYAFHNFGYLHVNQTEDQVGKAVRHFYNSRLYETRSFDTNILDNIRANYTLNEQLVAAMNFPISDASEDFEDREVFYQDWLYDYGFEVNTEADVVKKVLHFDAIIGTGNYRPAEQNMPFNKEDNGFFRGWHEGAAEYDGQHAGQGFVGSDAVRYRFVSSPYKLNDTNHYVSIKMAGTASLQILTENKEMLAEIKCQTFKTEGSQWQHDDGHMNTATMRRHIINLSAFKGQTVRFAICDYRLWGWGAAYFDDFNCNYDPASGINADIIEQYSGFHHDDEQGRDVITETYYTVQYDIYVPSTNNGSNEAIPNDQVFAGINYADDGAYSVENTADTSAMVKAHAFVMKYATELKGGIGNDICDSLVSPEVKALINEFNNLSEEEQAIVVASDDYSVKQKEGEEKEWYKIAPTFEEGRLGLNLTYLAEENNTPIDYVVAANGFHLLYTKTNSTYLITLIVIASAVAICLTIILINKKRKQRR